MFDHNNNHSECEDNGTLRTENQSRDRAAINRENAQHSSGPRTLEGKRIASLNAVKTALTGRTVLLETDDVELYRQHVAGWFAELKPEGLQEITLVQSIADSHWRNDRIVNIEAAIFARGRRVHCYENDTLYGDEVSSPSDIALLVDAQVNTIYERQLRNLHIQENRLRRQRESDMADLKVLQKERLEKAREASRSINGGEPADGTRQDKAGFVFSTSENNAKPDGHTAQIVKGRQRKGSLSRKTAMKRSRKSR